MGARTEFLLRWFGFGGSAVAFVLVSVGSRPVSALSPGSPGTTGTVALDSEAVLSGSPRPPSGVDDPVEPITLDATLVGTVAVEGGRSFALFEPQGGLRLVWEGDEVTAGTRLREVRTDRIVVERDGKGQHIFLGSRGGPPLAGGGTRPGAPGPGFAPTGVAEAAPGRPALAPRPARASAVAPEAGSEELAEPPNSGTRPAEKRRERARPRWQRTRSADETSTP